MCNFTGITLMVFLMPSDKKSTSPNCRSTCPISGALDILGDKWTLLIIRDLLLGKRRFKQFLESEEGITTNILTERLNRLVTHDIAEKQLSQEDSRYPEYRLTAKGEELHSLLGEFIKWGMIHVEGSTLEKGTPWS